MDAATPSPSSLSSEQRRARLLDIARRAVARLAESYRDRLLIATVTGSVARSSVDRHSDIDVILHFSTLPDATDFAREKALAIDSGGGFYGGDPENGWALYRSTEGAKLDLGFSRLADVEDIIADVIDRADTEPTKQLLIDGLRRGRCLHGADRLRALLAPTDDYPDALALAMIRAHLRFRPHWVLRGMGADRGDLLLLAEEFLAIANNLFGVLCGLNRVFSPGKMKGLGTADGPTFAVAPERFGERIAGLFAAPPHSAVEESRRLIEETLALVERHAPAVEVAEARRHFALCHAQQW
jgi:hypothetical protein